jgi:GPH family glycoside/pentoside/hexuronide:cation symporter
MRNITQSSILSYVSLTFPASAAAMPIVVYILPYYADNLGLGLSIVGLIFFIGRMLDVFTDPFMGYLIDKYPSRWGKHKHWIAISLPFLMVAIYLIYLPNQSMVSPAYLFFSLFIAYLGFTLLVVTQLSWSVVLAPSYDERTRLLTAREFVSLISMLVIIALPALIEIYTSSLEAKIQSIGVTSILLIPLIIITALIVVPDKKDAVTERAQVPALEMLKTVLVDRELSRLVFANLFLAFSQSLFGALSIIVFNTIFELPEYSARATLLYFIMGAVGLFIFRSLSLKTSKHFSASICLAFGSFIIILAWFISPYVIGTQYSIYLLFAFTFFYGLSFAGATPLIMAMVGDVSEMKEKESGYSKSGAVYAYVTTIAKIGFSLAAAIPYIILETFVGFEVSLGANNSEFSKAVLWNIYMLVPFFGYAIAGLMIYSHPHSREKVSEFRGSNEL